MKNNKLAEFLFREAYDCHEVKDLDHLYQGVVEPFTSAVEYIDEEVGFGKLLVLIDYAGDEDFNRAFWTMVQDFLDRKMEAGEAAPSE